MPASAVPAADVSASPPVLIQPQPATVALQRELPPANASVLLQALKETARSLQQRLRQLQRCGKAPPCHDTTSSQVEHVLAAVDQSSQGAGLDEHGSATHDSLVLWAAYVRALQACVSPGSTTGHSSAQQQLERVVRQAPQFLGAWAALGHLLWESGEHFNAYHCLIAGLTHAQSYASTRVEIGDSLQLGDTRGSSTNGRNTASSDAGQTSGCQAQQPERSQGQEQHLHQQQHQRHQQQLEEKQNDKDAAQLVADVLLQLSMIVRQASTQDSLGLQRHQALDASLSFARRAVKLTPEDGHAWYVLALAQLAQLFEPCIQPGSVQRQHKEVAQTFAAFAQAERCGGAPLADLVYNRAALHCYEHQFEAALGDYARAKKLDAGLPAQQQADALVMLLAQLSGLVATRAGIKAPKAWAGLMEQLGRDAKAARQLLPVLYTQPLELAPGLASLPAGLSRGRALLLRPLAFIQPPLAASSAVYVVCAAPDGGVCVLALVRVPHDAVQLDRVITLIHPVRMNVAVSVRGKLYSFPLLRCDADSVVLVDGVPLAQTMLHTGLHTTVL